MANAGLMVTDTHAASVEGYELTFTVNYLAHAQLIGDVLYSFVAPARIVLVGSDTYYQNFFRRVLRVPPAQWRDPAELARPSASSVPATFQRAGIAYSNSKLAILCYAHELQRRAPAGIDVVVFEPGFSPGTGLGRGHSGAMQQVGRAIQRIPGMWSSRQSGPALASMVLDDRWAHLCNGAFVVKSKEREVKPFAKDPIREARLWEATAELLNAEA